MQIEQSKIPPEVLIILKQLQSFGFESYLVGGCVRDLLLGRVPKDYDITTAAAPDQVKGIFPKVIDTGIKYGTVTVVGFDGVPVEVTTFRDDGLYKDGRRPESVTFQLDVTADVKRRDFTINSLLFDGQDVRDIVCGQYDLAGRRIRCAGRAIPRFEEDALRMLRAVRFACQLNFRITHETLAGIQVCSELINNVSAERVREELNKILLSSHPAKGIELLQSTGLLKYILPEVDALRHFDQRNEHHHLDAFDHSLRVLDATPTELTVRLAALLHDVGKPKSCEFDGVKARYHGHHLDGAELVPVILKRLKYPNEVIETVTILVKEHMSRNPHLRPASLKKLINRVGAERMPALFQLMYADIVGHKPPFDFLEIISMEQEVNRILTEKEPLKVTDLDFGGDDLIFLGAHPGPLFKRILNSLLEDVIDEPELNNSFYLYNRAAELLRQEGYETVP